MDNIVKKVCKELGLTYKQLGESIGYSEGTIRNIASKQEVSEPIKKAIELLYKLEKYKKELEECKKLRNTLNTFLSKGG